MESEAKKEREKEQIIQKTQTSILNQTTLLDLLKDNKIEDIFNVINQSEQKHDNTIITLSSRYYKLKEDIENGTILGEHKNVELNQIKNSLTSWIKTNFPE